MKLMHACMYVVRLLVAFYMYVVRLPLFICMQKVYMFWTLVLTVF